MTVNNTKDDGRDYELKVFNGEDRLHISKEQNETENDAINSQISDGKKCMVVNQTKDDGSEMDMEESNCENHQNTLKNQNETANQSNEGNNCMAVNQTTDDGGEMDTEESDCANHQNSLKNQKETVNQSNERDNCMTLNQKTDDCSEMELVESNDENPLHILKKQKETVNRAINSQLSEGDNWYLLDNRWYTQWIKYVDLEDPSALESSNPGPIDNSGIIDQKSGMLKEHLLERNDYQIINDDGWIALKNCYGLMPNQEPICRKVVQHGLYMKEKKLEVYLIELKLCSFNDMDNIVLKSFSKVSTIADVLHEAKKLLHIPEETETRVWSKLMQNTYEIITRMESTLQDNTITSGQMLVLELKSKNGEWTRQTRNRSFSGSSSTNTSDQVSSYSSMSYEQHRTTKPGLCGLANIGNTCFMNSALQCLSNTIPLTKYFLSNTYKHELNPNNPLGMQGKIAETYAELIHHVWGSNTYFTPRNFKMQVGRFAPQFSGYQQQDSHELLAFLLDGLHEDLNRVKQKPYIELQDDKGRPDEICAEEAWSNHTLRNSSIIVDLFHGLFKSTVKCPVCQKKSMTFDPFCYLSLPLPIKKERNLGIKFVPLDTSKTPLKVKVTVPKLGNILDLTSAVGNLTSTDPNKLMVADVFGSKFHKIYEPNESLSQITDRDDITIYEVPFNLSNSKNENILFLPVYLRHTREISYSYTYGYSNPLLFGTPILVSVPKDISNAKDLYQIILRGMRRYVKVPVNVEHTPISSEEDFASNKEPDSIEQISPGIEPSPNNIVDDEMLSVPVFPVSSCTEDMSDDQCDEPKIKRDFVEKELAKDNQKNKEKMSEDVTPDFLFQICVVNMVGSQNIMSLNYNDDKPVNLNTHSYLAIDCSPQFKKYYSEKLAQETEEHDSWNAVCPPKKTVNLNDCLDLFLQEEKLGEDDPWYCPQCKEHRQAFKKFDLWTLPKVLVIHLKRFSYNRYWRDKIDALVDFPVKQLDLTNYVINKNHPRAVYDLHAVSNHFGGLGGGHYTAYGVNRYDGQWYYFDDASVTSANTESVVSKAAYVLFYTRRDDPDTEIMNTSELLTEDISD
ncbi:ubiquitin carboxyl-terminal hydrolase 15 isoform X7 [Hydra vulgaris]|uniref:ubiquitinyl hydrolase 1 n=1 Tax=Hydra vulgaris TaxID=6087 RepID=A0ABM4CZK0_HYDVU